MASMISSKLRREHLWIIGGYLVSLLGIPDALAVCPKYSVQIGHAPPCNPIPSGAFPFALNELGHLVGQFSDCNGVEHPFIWTNGSFVTPLPISGAQRALAINSDGQIVGTRSTSMMQGYIYESGSITDFGTMPGGTYSEAMAVSEDGKVAGYWGNQVTGMPSKRAYIWSKGTMQDIDVQPGMDHTAFDINSESQITGWMGVSPNPPFYGEAYRWSKGVTVPLGYPQGGLNSVGRALNNLGDVCGHYVLPAPNGPSGTFVAHACFWPKGVAIDLGVLGGYSRSIAYDVNDHRQVVGTCEQANLVPQGFIWRNGVMARLNDVIPLDSNVQVWEARGINNNGQIAAHGRVVSNGLFVALRLTPIPVPPGDCDCNGQVGIQDLLNAIGQWGPSIPGTTADFDNNGTVNIHDLLTIIGNWD